MYRAFLNLVHIVCRNASLAMLLLIGVSQQLMAQSDTSDPNDSVLTQAPGEARFVKTRLGGFDAVSGVGHFTMPLGPRLPGRIPAGFILATDGTYLNSSVRPINWRIGNAQQQGAATYSNTVTLFGETLTFSVPASTVALPSASVIQGWMSTWNVTDMGKADADMAMAGFAVDHTGTLTASTVSSTQSVQATTDGTKFLVLVAWKLTKTFSYNGSRPATVSTVVYHPIVFALDTAYSIGQRLTTITNRWGDKVTIAETDTDSTGVFVIQNAKYPSHSITLTMNSTVNVDPTVLSAANLTVTHTLGNLPTVAATGVYLVPNPTPTWSGPVTWNGSFLPSSVIETASDGTSKTTSMVWDNILDTATPKIGLPVGGKFYWPVDSWPATPGGLNPTIYAYAVYPSTVWKNSDSAGHPILYPVALMEIEYPDGVKETLNSDVNFTIYYRRPFSISTPFWESNCWDKNTGQWKGFDGAVCPSLGMVFNSCLTTLADGSKRYILVVPTLPIVAWNNSNFTFQKFITFSHTTNIFTFAGYSDNPSGLANIPCRLVRLTHPDYTNSLTDSLTNRNTFLAFTSAIIQEEHIVAQGANGSTPVNPVTSKVIQYSGWDLSSWANPSQNLSLPCTAFPTRREIYNADMPEQVALAGDLNQSGRDAYGPVRSDIKTTSAVTGLPGQLWTGANALVWNTAKDNPSLNTSAVAEVIRTGFTGPRTMDLSTLTLNTTFNQTTGSGGGWSTVRGVGSTDFGKTNHSLDNQARLTTITTTRGAFTATESRTNFLGNTPLYQDVTKLLTDSTPNAIIGSGNVGIHYDYDATPFHWTQAETTKPDGFRTSYIRDDLGRIIQATDPHGVVTKTFYDPWGRVWVVARQAVGIPGTPGYVGPLVTTTTYDPNGTWTEVAVSGEGRTLVTRATVDGFGNVVEVDHKDANGGLLDTQITTFDGFNRRITQTPVLKSGQASYGTPGLTTWSYNDPLGRLSSITDPLGNPLMTVIQQMKWMTNFPDPEGGTLTGAVKTVADDRGKTRTEIYDQLGQLRYVIDQKGQKTTYSYNQDGHIAGVIQGTQARNYSYNDMGWMVSRSEPEEGPTVFSNFSIKGTPTLVKRLGRSGTGNRATTTYLDNKLLPYQVVSSGPDGTITRNLTIDPSTLIMTDLSEIQTVTNVGTQNLAEHYGYDGLFRLTSKTISDGVAGTTGVRSFTVAQTLDAFGNQTSLTYPSGGGRAAQVATTTYETRNRPKAVVLDGSLRGMMTYDQISGTADTTTLTYGNGASTMLKQDLGVLAETDYTWAGGAQNNAIKWTPGGLMTNRGSDQFSYDELQRLVYSKVQGLNGEWMEQWFGYDRWGNRNAEDWVYTASSTSSPNKPDEVLAWTAVYDATNGLPQNVTSITPGSWMGVKSPINGSMLATGRAYDDRGRITSVYAIPGQLARQASWVYDALDRVVQEGVEGSSSTFLLDSQGLRFKRTKQDGTIQYTIYGFGREALAVFEKPISGTQAPLVMTSKLAVALVSNTPNTASIDAPANGAILPVGVPIRLSGSSEAGGSFAWNITENGSGKTVGNPAGFQTTFTFPRVGTYTISLYSYTPGYTSPSTNISVAVVNSLINNFTATPAGIKAGASSVLAWNLSDPTAILSISGIGQVTGSSLTVKPATSTIYMLTATSLGGSAEGSSTAMATVTVYNQPPSIASFIAAATTITPGSSTRLSWAVSNATSLSISPGVGTVTGSGVIVKPATTTTYTLTATNAFGSVAAQVTVLIASGTLPTIKDFFADSYTMSAVGSNTLHWYTDNGTGTTLTVSDGSKTTPVTGASSLAVSPSQTTAYTLTAANSAGSVSATFTVTVCASDGLAWKRTMVYGFGQVLAEQQAGQPGTLFIMSDYVGSPGLITNDQAIVVGQTKGLPFGERMDQAGINALARFAGHEDQAGSPIYMQARMYLPAYGKFVSPDPAHAMNGSNPETWNLYNYVTNNPVTHFDPNGMEDPSDGSGGGPEYPDCNDPVWGDVGTGWQQKWAAGILTDLSEAHSHAGSSPYFNRPETCDGIKARRAFIDMQRQSPSTSQTNQAGNIVSAQWVQGGTWQDDPNGNGPVQSGPNSDGYGYSVTFAPQTNSEPSPYNEAFSQLGRDVLGLLPGARWVGGYSNWKADKSVPGRLNTVTSLTPVLGDAVSAGSVVGDVGMILGIFFRDSVLVPMVTNDNRGPQPFNVNGGYNPLYDEGAPF